MDPAGPPIPPSSPSALLMPLVIAVSIIATAALTLISFHLLVTKFCAAASRSFRIQPASGGVDKTTLESIPVLYYNKQHEENECVVCLGVFEQDEQVRVLPTCHHIFHVPCIDGWFASHSGCPVCRTVVTADAVTLPIDAWDGSMLLTIPQDLEEGGGGGGDRSLVRSGSLLWPCGASGLLSMGEKVGLKRFSSMQGLNASCNVGNEGGDSIIRGLGL